jgi:hypothetical protein
VSRHAPLISDPFQSDFALSPPGESMIVRINQFDPAGAEALTGWETHGLAGGIDHVWSPGTHAYEMLILEKDEKSHALDASFRQGQIRRLIPELILALCESRQRIVLRYDGPLVEGELLGAFYHLNDTHGTGRFAVSEAQKLDEDPRPVVGSVRIAPSSHRLGNILYEERIGLERRTRLRAFCLRQELVNPLLDASATDDERWGELLENCDFILSTVRGLQSVQIISNHISPNEARDRLTQRLLGNVPAAT